MTTNTTTPRQSLLARAALRLAMAGGAMLALPAYAWDDDHERRWDRHRQRDYRYHHDYRYQHDHRYQHGWRPPESRHRVYVTPGYGYHPDHHSHHYHYRDEHHRHEHDRGRDALAIIGGAVLLHEILHH
ncbi:MAG: hypothetical protein IT469_01400 [Pseudomonadales bacterium]|nr:hypothetical protein [Pseudomonadales bacterium]